LKRHLKRRKISKFKKTEKSQDPITQAPPYDSQFSVPSFRMLDQIPVPAASVLDQVKRLHDVKIIKIKSAKIRKSQPLNQEIFRAIGVQETKKSSDSPLLRFGSMLAKQ
jgi:hypothetical protein